MDWRRYEKSCCWNWPWSNLCGTVEGLLTLFRLYVVWFDFIWVNTFLKFVLVTKTMKCIVWVICALTWQTVSLLQDPQNSSRNRGYAFIEYYNHACAEYSRQKMSNSNFKLGSNAPTVSWADPRNSESSAISLVIYYIFN